MSAAPPSPPPRRHNPRVSITQSQLDRLLQIIDATANPTIISALKANLPRSLNVIHPSDFPEAESDMELASRVTALHARANALSTAVETDRARVLPQLRTRLSESLAPLSAILSSMPSDTSPPPELPFASLVGECAATLDNIPTAIERATSTAQTNRGRADKLREALRLISANAHQRTSENASHHGNGEVSRTLTADVSRILASDPVSRMKGGSALTGTDGSMDDGDDAQFQSPSIPVHAPPEDRDDDDMLALSPFITPRSKTRKRLIRASTLLSTPKFQLPR